MGHFADKEVQEQEAVLDALRKRMDRLNWVLAWYAGNGRKPPERLTEAYVSLEDQYANIVMNL